MRTTKRKKRARESTGAPDAYFLLALADKSPTASVIRGTLAERSSLAQVPTGQLAREIYFRLVELASRVRQLRTKAGKPENAAEDLATVATVAASLLEDLAQTDAKTEVMLAAAHKNRWPVNLQLGIKQQKRKTTRTLQGAERAKDYLVSIRLGESPSHVLKHLHNKEANPFARAAELLLIALHDLQQHGTWHKRSRNLEWFKKLLALEYPMTTEQVGEWWAVAKQWMDEQWSSNRNLFIPLIEHLKLNKPAYTASIVKRQVVDDSLKKAFKALAAKR